jgi:hypothetical protein
VIITTARWRLLYLKGANCTQRLHTRVAISL